MMMQTGDKVRIDRSGLEALLSALMKDGYHVLGPTIRENAIVYGTITSIADLPAGWTDEQDGGTYRLKRRNDEALFGYAVGPHSWKQFLHPPALRLWQAEKSSDGFHIIEEKTPEPRYAIIGARSCELHAIAIQDNVFLQENAVDPNYKAKRENLFMVAVNCAVAGGTCFCVSMKTGPKATFGFDLALTEIITPPEHFFVVEAGTEKGALLLSTVTHQEGRKEDAEEAEKIVQRTAGQMGRTMDTAGIKELLYDTLEHPRWEEVANRCLSCSNCTMVCPTCFCTTVEDVTDLTEQKTERWQKWDSCFTMDFSYMHGGSIRSSPKARYRQWMTHKLATWIDQFGTSGCVGCGRCITWCPVGIDITEEVAAIRANPQHGDSPVGTVPTKGEHHGKS